jgi:hypothetical protein
MVLQIPGCQVGWQPLNLEGPGSGTRRERSLQNGPECGGIALRPHQQPVVEIARRPEILRRDEDAPAGPEGTRERDRPVGRVAIERHVYPAHSPKQR